MQGHIYFCTGRGVDQLSVDTGRIRHYGVNDGLAADYVNVGYRDRQGALWFGTLRGVSRLVPGQDVERTPPPILIGSVRIAGALSRISAVGDTTVGGLVLTPAQNRVEVEFLSPSFAVGESIRFQYKLDGSEEWSAPTDQRRVTYAGLAPGPYRLLIRAVNDAGMTSPTPASLAFRILPPIWRRWWFVTLAVLVGLGGLTAFDRYRVANLREIGRAREERLIALEEVRRRIAADLHDEIGSSLTQISILSEVARQQGADAMPELGHPLSMIAASSRDLVDAMSDIVWAINPAKDHLADLVQRMRRLAADTFSATNTTCHLELPPPEQEMKLGANVRREVFLIFKEAVNNIVKHSACSEVGIKLAIDGALLRLELRDDGRGFDPLVPSEGHGLSSLRNRAAALGGTLAVVSAPGAGTAITFDLPMTT
jgi:signal transduction histidine kinase